MKEWTNVLQELHMTNVICQLLLKWEAKHHTCTKRTSDKEIVQNRSFQVIKNIVLVELAISAAQEAFPEWSSKSPEARSQILYKLADLIEAHLEEFAQAESKDQGKTITVARNIEIPRASYNFRFFASSILHHTTDCTQMDRMSCTHFTTRTPVGVAGLISPWNMPLYLLTWKIAPAIAMGNTVIAKPSEMTSVTAWMMCKLFDEAGTSLKQDPHPHIQISSYPRTSLPHLSTCSFTQLTQAHCASPDSSVPSSAAVLPATVHLISGTPCLNTSGSPPLHLP
uniref:Aldehyde dehydrogenase domain-containing protein n=1 Tax=Callorhinchus milii TaxID=7868 RepID=A0A4W3JQ58_CALMI